MVTLTDNAREAVKQIIAALPERRRAALLADLSQADIEDRNGLGSILGFKLPGHAPVHFRGKLLPVEGAVDDADGEGVEVLLFVDAQGRLSELELVRYATGDLKGPNWTTFRLRG